MWDLLGAGIEPTSPALAGGFLTTELPGTPTCHNSHVYRYGDVLLGLFLLQGAQLEAGLLENRKKYL